MATAWASTAAAIVSLRSRAGQHTSLKALSDADATECLEAALDAVNLARPIYQLGSFNSVAATYSYTGASAGTPPALRLEPLKVFYRGDGAGVLSIFADEYTQGQGTGDLGPIETRVLNALLDDATVAMSQDDMATAWDGFERLMERITSEASGFEDAAGAVILQPTPTSATKVFWIAKVPRFSALTAVDAKHREAVLLFAEARACSIISGTQSEAKSISWAPGRSLSTDGGGHYAARATAAMAEFEAWSGAGSGVSGTA